MTDLDLDALEATASALNMDRRNSYVTSATDTLALIARIREAEREMRARELHHFEAERLLAEAESKLDLIAGLAASSIPNAELRHNPYAAVHELAVTLAETERHLREAEATIDAVEALLPKWAETRAYNAEAFTKGEIGTMREIDYHGDLARILTRHQDKRENGSRDA